MDNIFYKEIDLLGMKCEHVILGNEVSYYTEAGSGFKEKMGKIIEAIKSFFSKLKAKVQEKIRSDKIKKDVKRLNAIIADKKSNGIMIDIDTTKNLVEVRMATFLRDAQKATSLKNPEKVKAAFNKVYEAACKDIDLYISASKGGKLHKKFIKRVKLREAAKMALAELKNVNSDLDKVYKELSATVKKSTSIRSMFKESTNVEDGSYLEAGEPEETNSESNSIAITIASKVQSIGSKVGTFVAKHPFIITAAVFNAGRVTGRMKGESRGYIAGQNSGYKKGYDEGLDVGHKNGYSSGYTIGLNDGIRHELSY